MNMKAQLAILLVLVGCMSNVIFLELMIQEDPGAGNLITFSQFLVIALEGFVFTTKFLTVKPKVPFTAWITLVIMFFLVRSVKLIKRGILTLSSEQQYYCLTIMHITVPCSKLEFPLIFFILLLIQ